MLNTDIKMKLTVAKGSTIKFSLMGNRIPKLSKIVCGNKIQYAVIDTAYKTINVQVPTDAAASGRQARAGRERAPWRDRFTPVGSAAVRWDP